MNKKVLILASVLLMVSLLVGSAYATDSVQEQLIQEVQKQPVSLFTYVHYTWDFLSKAAERFAESAKPLIIFNNTARMGGEITWYEEKLFALTIGKYLKEEPETPSAIEFEEGWFFGFEFKPPVWPEGTDLGEMLSKARPQIVFHRGSWYFGLSYKFRNEIE